MTSKEDVVTQQQREKLWKIFGTFAMSQKSIKHKKIKNNLRGRIVCKFIYFSSCKNNNFSYLISRRNWIPQQRKNVWIKKSKKWWRNNHNLCCRSARRRFNKFFYRLELTTRGKKTTKHKIMVFYFHWSMVYNAMMMFKNQMIGKIRNQISISNFIFSQNELNYEYLFFINNTSANFFFIIPKSISRFINMIKIVLAL